ncbi:hypothetical protein [Nocardia neocaledoniensis]|uniref:hypothetical protein n=1 Tax=Nocardia neocaledoniensis TaxID=236511 RepID=UPI0024553517|nr:hypothetical protein [Nocardia neocaledoniensis]
MVNIAVRHGALDTNPVDGVAPFRKVSKPARCEMADMQALPAFCAQVRTRARGEEVPGTPAYVSGPQRDWTMVWVVDVITSVGIRPYEVFALLLDDINLDAPHSDLDVTGTLEEIKGAGNGERGAPREDQRRGGNPPGPAQPAPPKTALISVNSASP